MPSAIIVIMTSVVERVTKEGACAELEKSKAFWEKCEMARANLIEVSHDRPDGENIEGILKESNIGKWGKGWFRLPRATA